MVQNERAKLVPSDGAKDDDFGGSVAITGDIAVVGTGDDDDKGSNSGSAYIFQALFLDFGKGCPGSGNFVPVLSGSGNPTPGGQAKIALDKGLGASVAILFFGAHKASIPISSGCMLLVLPLPWSLSPAAALRQWRGQRALRVHSTIATKHSARRREHAGVRAGQRRNTRLLEQQRRDLLDPLSGVTQPWIEVAGLNSPPRPGTKSASDNDRLPGSLYIQLEAQCREVLCLKLTSIERANTERFHVWPW